MISLANYLNRIANWKTLLLLVAFYMSFPAYWLKNAEATIKQLAGRDIGPIDLTFGFNPTRTLTMVADYGPAARACYARIELTTDLVYPLVYSLLLAVLLTLVFRHRPNWWVILLPVVCLLSDYFENAAIVTLLITYPTQSTGVAVLCEVFKAVKWLSFVIAVGLIMYGTALHVLSRLRITKP